MVTVGQEFSNPRSGERFVWRATRASTAGAYCEFDLYLDTGAKLAAAHIHPHQTETFTVVRGRIRLRAGREARELAEKGVGVIPPGTPHSWGNAAPGPSHVVVRLAPALDIEDFFAAFCTIAAEGGATRSGLPRNPLLLAVLLDGFRNEFGFPTPALRVLLGPVLRVVAGVARRAGVQLPPIPAATGLQGTMPRSGTA
jgi:quercetin dioxygenase-like cupin family protein